MEENNIDRLFNFTTSKIIFNNEASSLSDKEYDEGFLSRNTFKGFEQNDYVDLGTLSSEDAILKINSLNPETNHEITLHTEFSSFNDFKLNISLENYNLSGMIILEDSYLDELIPMDSKDEINYDFETTSDSLSKSKNRFKLHVNLDPVSLESSNNEAHLKIFPNPTLSTGFYFSSPLKYSKISIKNMTGNTLLTVHTKDLEKNFIQTSGLNPGLYLVTFIDDTSMISKYLTIK